MANSAEIYDATAETMEALSPLNVIYLTGESGGDFGVIYDCKYFSVLFSFLLYGYESNCLMSYDVKEPIISSRNWYFTNELFSIFHGFSDEVLVKRSQDIIDLDEKDIYAIYAKEAVELLSIRGFHNAFPELVIGINSALNDEIYKSFLDSANLNPNHKK